MQNSRIGWRKRLAASIACALVAALSFSGMEMTASADEQTDGSQAQGVHAVNNADVPVIEPDSPEAKLYSLPDEAADDDSEDATADDAEEDYDPEDFFADAAPLEVSANGISGRGAQPRGSLWSLGAHGELLKVEWDGKKYVPKESRDIPYGKMQCHYPFNSKDRDGVFDGLALSDSGNMYALETNAATRNPGGNLNYSGTSIFKRDAQSGKWVTYKLQKQSGSWRIIEQPLSYGPCVNGEYGRSYKAANYNHNGRNDNFNQSSYNHTFAFGYTHFTSGSVVNVNGKEYYVFGGYSFGAGVAQPAAIKFFAFDPERKTVDYLGYTSISDTSKDSTINSGDFTTDADGNIYYAVSSKGGREDYQNVIIRRISADKIKDRILRAGNFRFSGADRDGWGGKFSSMNGQHTGGSDLAISADTFGSTQNYFSTGVWGSQLGLKDQPRSAPNKMDTFAGFDLTPDGHVTLSFTATNEYDPTKTQSDEFSEREIVVEYDRAGNKVNEATMFRYPLTQNQYGWVSDSAYINSKTGGTGNAVNTDIIGSLYVPPKRWLKITKAVDGRMDTNSLFDQFMVDMNPTGVYNNNTNYRINGGDHRQLTYFSSDSGEQVIGRGVENADENGEIKLPGGDFEARIGERTYSGDRIIPTKGRYDTTIQCSEGVRIKTNKETNTEIVDGAGNNRFVDIVVDKNASGHLECKLTNTGKKPKKPKAHVLIYKNFESFYDGRNDTFNVGFRYKGQDQGFDTSTQYNTNNNYRMASVDVTAGDTISVFEKNAGGNLNNYYDPTLRCFHGDPDDEGNNIPLQSQMFNNNGAYRGYVTIPAPQKASKNISCIVSNRAHPQETPQPQTKTVRVHKQFDHRYHPSDNFTAAVNVISTPYKAVSVTTDGIGSEKEGTDFVSQPIDFAKDATIFVREVGSDGADLKNYDQEITCSSGGTELNGEFAQLGVKAFSLTNATSNEVDCYVKNTAKPKTVHLHKKFTGFAKDADVFQLSLSRPQIQNIQNARVKSEFTTGLQAGVDKDLVQLKARIGSQVTIRETPKPGTGTEANKYDAALVCYKGAEKKESNKLSSPQNGSNFEWNLNIETANEDEVHCYLENSPKEQRTITVQKLFKNDKDTNGFSISGYFNNDTGNSFYLANTNGHQTDVPFTVTPAPKTIPKGDVQVVINEGESGVKSISDYNISVVCKDKAADPNLETEDDHTVKLSGEFKPGDRWEASGSIPAKLTGSITCTLINEKPANTKVVLYKDLKVYDSTDQFNVGLESLAANYGAHSITGINVPGQLTSLSIDDGYSRYKIGTVENRPKGQDFQFKIEETAQNGADLANYTSKVTCKAVNAETKQETDINALLNRTMSDDSGNRSVTLTIPENQKGEVHCYLRNEPMPKGSITIHKISSIGDTALAGSVWEVQKKNSSGGYDSVGFIGDDNQNMDNIQGTRIDDATASAPGTIKISKLQVGRSDHPITYKVIERVAPAGFQLPDENEATHSFALSVDYVDVDSSGITNTPAESPDLPFTGGLGTIPYMLGGLSVLFGAIAVTTLTGGKRRKKN